MIFLVTGGLGFVGSRFIEIARRELEGAKFIIFDNFSVGKLENLSSFVDLPNVKPLKDGESLCISHDITVVKGDIRNVEDIERVGDELDVIIHLAGNTGVQPSLDNPMLDLQSNIIGTFNILNFAKSKSKLPRVIFSSSNAPLGEAEQPVSEKSPCAPLSPYGASKLAAEGYLSAYNSSFGVPTISLRFGNLYGVGSTHKSSVVAKFIKHALAGEPLEIYGNGKQTRDFIYVEDLVEAITLAATRAGVGGHKFQIATSRESTVAEVAEMVTAILGNFGVKDLQVNYQGARLGDVMRNYSDVSKAAEKLGWTPQHDLQAGLEKTIKYFYDNHRGQSVE